LSSTSSPWMYQQQPRPLGCQIRSTATIRVQHLNQASEHDQCWQHPGAPALLMRDPQTLPGSSNPELSGSGAPAASASTVDPHDVEPECSLWSCSTSVSTNTEAATHLWEPSVLHRGSGYAAKQGAPRAV
jgi:hypothetical protein